MRDPYLTTEYVDRETGVRGYLVIGNLVRDVACGGLRIHPDASVEVVRALALGMSHKTALTDVPVGGAKAGIRMAASDPRRSAVLRRFLQAISPFVRHYVILGSDIGSTLKEVASQHRELGLFEARLAVRNRMLTRNGDAFESMQSDRVRALTVGDLRNGCGIAGTVDAVLSSDGQGIRGKSVAVQGFGKVGASAVEVLANDGARVVAVADVEGLIAATDPGGELNVAELIARAGESGVIDRQGLGSSCRFAPRDEIMRAPVDILVLAATENAITGETVNDVAAKIVACGANLAVSADVADSLAKRGVIVIPPVLASSGTIASVGMADSQTGEELLTRVREKLFEITRTALALGSEEHLPLHKAAALLAERRLQARE